MLLQLRLHRRLIVLVLLSAALLAAFYCRLCMPSIRSFLARRCSHITCRCVWQPNMKSVGTCCCESQWHHHNGPALFAIIITCWLLFVRVAVIMCCNGCCCN